MACSNDVTSSMSSQKIISDNGRGAISQTFAGLEGSQASYRSERFSSIEIR